MFAKCPLNIMHFAKHLLSLIVSAANKEEHKWLKCKSDPNPKI